MCLLEGSNLEFALKKHDEKVKEDRFSPTFRLDLLPACIVYLLELVPKSHSLDLHLVTVS